MSRSLWSVFLEIAVITMVCTVLMALLILLYAVGYIAGRDSVPTTHELYIIEPQQNEEKISQERLHFEQQLFSLQTGIRPATGGQ